MTESLDDVQAWMAAQLVRRQALPADEEAVQQAARHAAGNDRLRPVDQVEIYRRQFWLRHTASLVEDFPGLCGILGQTDWERLVEEYLVAYPPTDWSLSRLGARMPEHVARATWLPHAELCADMALLECAYTAIFEAHELPRLDPARLGAISEDEWSRARLVTNPALYLLRARYAVAELRQQLRSASKHDTVPIPEPAPTNYALYRGAQGTLHHEALSAAAFAVLSRLVAGQPLLGACESAATEDASRGPEIEASLGAWLTDWARLGFIVDVVSG